MYVVLDRICTRHQHCIHPPDTATRELKCNIVASGPVVAGRKGNGEYFVGTLFEVWARLVPRNTSTKTGSGTVYKRFKRTWQN